MSLQIDSDRAALILVDIQPDFMPGGALATVDGDQILEPVQRLIDADRFDLHAATQDWHPPGHVSFASRHEGREPMEVVQLYGADQVLWPDHCVQGTRGAELHPGLDWSRTNVIVRKGMDPKVDSYSGFRDNIGPDGERPPTGLAGYLGERDISDVVVCGLARDVCVKWTAEDAVAAGFRTHFVWDLTRPVTYDSDERTREDLQQAGVQIIELADLLG